MTRASLRAIVLVALIASACAEEQALSPSMQPSIQDVTTRHAAELMAIPGVVSVGIGRGADGAPAIVVGLAGEDAAAREALPERLEGFEVRAEVVGRFRAQ